MVRMPGYQIRVGRGLQHLLVQPHLLTGEKRWLNNVHCSAGSHDTSRPYVMYHTTPLRPFSANNGSKSFRALLDFMTTKKSYAKKLFLG